MFNKSKTRIILINGSVVVLREVQLETIKCRMFIDGIEMGYLVETDGALKPENKQQICPTILIKINEMAKRGQHHPEFQSLEIKLA